LTRSRAGHDNQARVQGFVDAHGNAAHQWLPAARAIRTRIRACPVKTPLRSLLFAAYCLLVVAAIFYFGFWLSHRHALLTKESEATVAHRLEPPRHVDRATMRLLGSLHQSKDSSFVNFDEAKPAGYLRVCALGDSNTEGAELEKRHDYPSYLQRMFQQRGFERVQVLNFGNGWHGFSQIYVMWKYVAKRFGCDYVTLLPMSFWEARDITFNHTDGRMPGYLHARLVVENDQRGFDRDVIRQALGLAE
jgi:hypothetical protein